MTAWWMASSTWPGLLQAAAALGCAKPPRLYSACKLETSIIAAPRSSCQQALLPPLLRRAWQRMPAAVARCNRQSWLLWTRWSQCAGEACTPSWGGSGDQVAGQHMVANARHSPMIRPYRLPTLQGLAPNQCHDHRAQSQKSVYRPP
jgi:hypothetical protein